MVLRHVSSACFAEDVHTSLHFLWIGIYDWYDHNIRLFEMCLIVASMIFHSRMMYVDNGTGQSSLYFTVLLVPRRSHYALSCVRREIWLYDSRLKFSSLWNSHYVFIFLLYATTFGLRRHIASWHWSFSVVVVLYLQCVFRVVIVFTSWHMCHVDIVCFWFSVRVLLRFPRH